MRGYPLFNFPAFDAAADELRAAGHEVWSPAEWDRGNGFDPATGTALTLAEYMAIDLPEVCRAEAVVVMPGWEASQGATLEVYVARAVGLPVLTLARAVEGVPAQEGLRLTQEQLDGLRGAIADLDEQEGRE
jgi:hypothetical protein